MKEQEAKRKMRDAEKLKKIEEEKKLEDKITGRNRRMKTATTVKNDQAVEEEKVSVTSEGIFITYSYMCQTDC